jgi:hypothetical protein
MLKPHCNKTQHITSPEQRRIHDPLHLNPKAIKAIKAKKADIRPNLAKVDVWTFRALTMVSQHSKGSYKVP